MMAEYGYFYSACTCEISAIADGDDTPFPQLCWTCGGMPLGEEWAAKQREENAHG